MPRDAKQSKWQNRIVGYGEKVASEFKFNPLNWRKHPESQQAALREILDRVGWVTGVIENVRTGNLIDGHLRVQEALETKQTEPSPDRANVWTRNDAMCRTNASRFEKRA